MLAGILLVVLITVLIALVHWLIFVEAAIDYGKDAVYRNYHQGTLGKAYNAGWEREKRRQIIIQENIDYITEENK